MPKVDMPKFGDSRMPQAFWLWVVIDAVTGCWIWTGPTVKGYGWLHVAEMPKIHRGKKAYRVCYEALVGPLPDGIEPDHLCRVRVCVNPAHMEPVTKRVNLLRGESPFATNARKTECIRQHALAGANLYMTPDGRRQCRTCIAIRSRAHVARRGGGARA